MSAVLKVVKALSMKKAMNKAADETFYHCEVSFDFQTLNDDTIGSVIQTFFRLEIQRGTEDG